MTAGNIKASGSEDRKGLGDSFLARWLVPALWSGLLIVVLLMFALAAVLLVKSHVLSAKSLTDAQTKNLWTFLGVAFGAVVTLIGALLTEQHNRRTDALTRQTADREQVAREQQQLLARETEDRLKIDTVTKVLELITVEGGNGYAPSARVAGAIATLMQLGGGIIGLRILGELWTAGAVDSPTATWLLSQIFGASTSTKDEVIDAAEVLATHAHRLIPNAQDPEQDTIFWPSWLGESWPVGLPDDAKNSIYLTLIRMLLARDISWWQRQGDQLLPILVLLDALDDTTWRDAAALALKVLSNSGQFEMLSDELDPTLKAHIEELSSSEDINPWGESLLQQLRQWAAGQTSSEIGISPESSRQILTTAPKRRPDQGDWTSLHGADPATDL
jgi:hypothetical protein